MPKRMLNKLRRLLLLLHLQPRKKLPKNSTLQNDIYGILQTLFINITSYLILFKLEYKALVLHTYYFKLI